MNKKRATIKDVADAAGVSISVVSYVLNNSKEKTISEPTKKRVLAAADKLSYIPNRIASGMRRSRTMSIGVVSYWKLSGSVFVSILNGIIETAYKNSYSVVMCNPKTDEDEFSYINNYFNKTVDGFLFVSPHEAIGTIDESAHIEKMKSVGVPFSIINGHGNKPHVNYINFDFYGATHLATNYLISKGHREITYVAPFDVDYSEYKQRYLGYHDAILAENLEERICCTKEIAEKIHNFKAVVTNKSDTAHMVMKEAFYQGYTIPKDFALISGNTESFAQFLLPPLSTVMTDYYTIGERATQAVIRNLDGDNEYVNELSSCFLQIRDTC